MFHCFCLCAYSVFPSRLLTVSSGRVRHMLYSSLYQQSLTPCLGGNTMFITSQLWDFSHKHLWHCGSLFHICCLLVCSPIRAVFGAVVVIFTLKLGQSIEKLDDFPKVTLWVKVWAINKSLEHWCSVVSILKWCALSWSCSCKVSINKSSSCFFLP